MHDQYVVTAAPVTEVGSRVGDINQQIAQQDVVIITIRQRLAVASLPRIRFSFRALFNQFSIEAELVAAREARGALLHDRRLAQVRG